MSKRPFTDKQQQFINHYVQTLNATEAARRAGYSGDDNALAQRGHENVRNSKIRAEIDRLLAESTMSADEVVARLTDHARGDLEDFFKVDPRTGYVSLDLQKAHERGKWRLIKRFKFNKDGFLEGVELHDPQAALVHLGKIHALFKDVVEQNWKIELQKQGLNPSDVFEQLVRSIAENIPASAESVDDGGDG